MMKRMGCMGLLLAMLLASAQVCAAGPTLLWELRDVRGNLRAWLFGTIHVCDAACFPLPGVVREAFAKADVLALELDPDDPQLVVQLRKAGTLPPGVRLAERLPPELNARLERVAAGFGLPAEAIQRLQPWMVATLLSLQAAEKAGYGASQGVDLWLARQARARGLPLLALETAKQQVTALGAGGDEAQLAYLTEVVELVGSGEASTYFSALLQAWREGDVAALDRLLREEMSGEAMRPLLEALLDQRNREMAVRIDKQLKAGRRPFVAVGAGHLGGPSGLLAQLAGKGYRLRQLDDGAD